MRAKARGKASHPRHFHEGMWSVGGQQCPLAGQSAGDIWAFVSETQGWACKEAGTSLWKLRHGFSSSDRQRLILHFGDEKEAEGTEPPSSS